MSRRGAFGHRTRTFALLTLLTLLASACTGTREEQSATLLIVGTVQGATPQLALVEDRRDGTALDDRMSFVPDSLRTLRAPAVSIDVTARELGRDTAWVLARSVAGTAVSAYLHRFDVANIDLTDPVGFAEVGTELVLVEPGGGGILPAEQTTNSVICPSALQSSRSGRWLLVLDVPAHCVPASSEFPVVWLVDTQAGSATSLQVNTPDPVLAVAPYTDQRQDDERGFFLVAGTTSAQVFEVDFENATSNWYAGQLLAADPNELVAMAGRGSVLVALTNSQLVGADLSVPANRSQLGPVPALGNGRQLVVDPLNRSDHALVLGASQVEVHTSLADDAPDTDRLNYAAAGATIDAFRAFAYLLQDSAVVVVDLYTGGASGDPLAATPFEVPELTLPLAPSGRRIGAISWVRAADPPPAP